MLEGKGRDFQRYIESELIGDIKAIRLLRDDGLVIGSSSPAEVNTYYPQEKIHLLAGESAERFSKIIEDTTNTAGVYSLYIPLYNEMFCQRCHTDNKKIRAILGIEISSMKYFEAASGIKRKAFLNFIILVVLSTGIIWLLAGVIFEKPIRDILSTVEKVKKNDLRARIITERLDEIGDMARGINEIISDLERTRKDFELCHLAEMRRVQEMATLGELASAIAHEIRNPLAGISGAVQVLSEEFPASDPRQPIIKEILNEVERLDRSVKDLLIFAKTPDLSLKHVPAKFIFERLVRFIEPQAKRSNVNIVLQIPEDQELYVDPDHIHQAFFNIAQSSIQNMPEGGTLKIELITQERFHAVLFSDTGPGIPPDEIKLLFKPFYTRQSGSSSLGLTISRGIIEKHGGRIEVESIIGKGTTFSVYLPYRIT
ncbi:MAG: ATP-binding protein [Thermodesulfovibrionales bacterium]|nr:ATP-binding protein [Thermodesulfovibrionales bacterium]